MNPAASRREFLTSTLGAGAAAILPRPCAPAAEPAAASPWQIGCYTRPWDRFDYRVALDAIAEAGYRHVGLMTTKSATSLVISTQTAAAEARAIGEEARKRGLAIASVYGGEIPVAESLEAGIAGMRRLLDCCAAAGAANLMMGGIGDAALYDRYYGAIAAACPRAAELGLAISVKPHGGLNATGPQCRAAIEKVGQKNFGLWYDPGNIFYYSDGALDPVADAATVDGLVMGVSIKDYRHPRDVMVTPGTGKVDFEAVLRRLMKGGFTGGPLIVETLAQGEPADLLREARAARRFLGELADRLAAPPAGAAA